jgi:5'(3')-deoxyribonucleotidase
VSNEARVTTVAIRESIAIDIDDVLADHVEAFIEFSNRNYNTQFSVQDYDDDWKSLWNVDRDEVERRASEFHSSENLAAFAVKDRAKLALKSLAARYDLYIVTARRQKLIDTTHEWISRHFPGTFQGVHFVPIWEPDNTVTKAEICRAINATYLIDDLPRHINIAATGGIKAILFGAYTWNMNEPVEKGVTLCKDWDSVLEYFTITN